MLEGNTTKRKKTLEMIQQEKEQEIEEPRIKEQNEKDEIGNLQDLYNEL